MVFLGPATEDLAPQPFSGSLVSDSQSGSGHTNHLLALAGSKPFRALAISDNEMDSLSLNRWLNS